MISQQKLSFLTRIDFAILSASDWIKADEKRATIAILSATTAIFFVWGLCMFSNMPLPEIPQ